jgi:hypothetical protein
VIGQFKVSEKREALLIREKKERKERRIGVIVYK